MPKDPSFFDYFPFSRALLQVEVAEKTALSVIKKACTPAAQPVSEVLFSWAGLRRLFRAVVASTPTSMQALPIFAAFLQRSKERNTAQSSTQQITGINWIDVQLLVP